MGWEGGRSAIVAKGRGRLSCFLVIRETKFLSIEKGESEERDRVGPLHIARIEWPTARILVRTSSNSQEEEEEDVRLLLMAISTNRTTARGEGVTWVERGEATTTVEEEAQEGAGTTGDTTEATTAGMTTAGGMTVIGEEETTGSQTHAGEAGPRRLVVGMMITREVSVQQYAV